MYAGRASVPPEIAGFQPDLVCRLEAGGPRIMARLRGRYVLAVTVAALLAGALLLGSRPVTAAPVLYVRLVTRCFVGVTNTPSPCPTETWIDERSGVVRE